LQNVKAQNSCEKTQTEIAARKNIRTTKKNYRTRQKIWQIRNDVKGLLWKTFI